MKLGFRVNRAAGAKSAEMFIYGVIGDSWDGIDAKMVLDQIKDLGDVQTLDVHINSPGGYVSDGIAIHSALKRLKATVTTYNDGLAASMGSILFQAGDRRVMAEGSLLMIHDPISFMWGNAGDMRKEAEILDTHKETLMGIYLNSGFLDADPVRLSALMTEETWLKGEDAVANGLADEVEGEMRAAALLDDKTIGRLFHKEPVVDLSDYMKPESNETLDTAGGLSAVEDEGTSKCRSAPRSLLERQLSFRESMLKINK